MRLKSQISASGVAAVDNANVSGSPLVVFSRSAIATCSSARAFVRSLFSYPVLLGALLVLTVFISVCMNLQQAETPGTANAISIFEGDTWFHILQGEDILRTRAWPTTDSYSYTAHGND